VSSGSTQVENNARNQAIASHWISNAHKHYQLHESSEARYWAEKALHIAPLDARAMNLLGRLAMDDNQIDQALTQFHKARALAPLDTAIQLNLGYAYLTRGQHLEAQALFANIVALEPGNTHAEVSLAYTLLLQGETVAAFARYRAAFNRMHYSAEPTHNAHVMNALADCCAQLVIDRYSAELEADLNIWFEIDAFDRAMATPLVTQLLVHKYDLHNPDSAIEIDALIDDALLHHLVAECLIDNPQIEELVAALRASIFIECTTNETLPDRYLPWVLALGLNGVRNGHVMAMSNDEIAGVVAVEKQLRELFNSKTWHPEEAIGALLLVAMYQPLFDRPYSVDIARFDLADWPQGSHAVMDAAYYAYQDRTAIAFDLRNAVISAGSENLARVMPHYWSHLEPVGLNTYIDSVQQTLKNYQVANELKAGRIRLLALGCDAGYNALQIAANFSEVDVTVVDANRNTLIHAMMMAARYGLDNVEFHTASIDALDPEASFDIIECGAYLNYVDDVNSALHLLLERLAGDGIVRMQLNNARTQAQYAALREFVIEREIKPVRDHVRALRQAVMADKGNDWRAVIASNWFYQQAQCVNMLFVAQREFTVADIRQLCRLHELNLLTVSQGLQSSDGKTAIKASDTAPQFDIWCEKPALAMGQLVLVKPSHRM
jgi:2-polyprenyl-3-methyl-5-hydroxy-6-metoxy-1,4-benzoquinol methylase